MPAKPELKVHFIDVGQGDSILIDLEETEILIDGGEKSSGVIQYLKKYVDGPLEVMVATHAHTDHYGGLIDVLSNFKVEQIWHNGETSTAQTFSHFTSAIKAEGADVHIAKRGDKITSGQLSLSVLNPIALNDTTNNNSIVLSLSYGKVDFLFTGDAEREAESGMLQAGVVPQVEILKVGHHGSRTASSPAFLTAVKPQIAVYSAGQGNRYGHPHQETTNNFSQIGSKIYGTDVNGSVVITTYGESFTMQTGK